MIEKVNKVLDELDIHYGVTYGYRSTDEGVEFRIHIQKDIGRQAELVLKGTEVDEIIRKIRAWHSLPDPLRILYNYYVNNPHKIDNLKVYEKEAKTPPAGEEAG